MDGVNRLDAPHRAKFDETIGGTGGTNLLNTKMRHRITFQDNRYTIEGTVNLTVLGRDKSDDCCPSGTRNLLPDRKCSSPE